MLPSVAIVKGHVFPTSATTICFHPRTCGLVTPTQIKLIRLANLVFRMWGMTHFGSITFSRPEDHYDWFIDLGKIHSYRKLSFISNFRSPASESILILADG